MIIKIIKIFLIPLIQKKLSKEGLNKKPLLIKPTNKVENSLVSSNKKNLNNIKNPNPPTIVSNLKSQALSKTQNKTNTSVITTPNLKDKKDPSALQDKKPLKNSSGSPAKTTARPPIQLIEKPKNLANSNRNINANKINNSVNQRAQSLNRADNNKLSRADNNNFPKKNLNSPNVKSTPELVGAPIRREDPKINTNRPNSNSRQPSSNTQISANRPGGQNRQGVPNREGGGPYRQGSPNRPGTPYRQGASGIRKPVAPNELMQLQKTNASNKEKPNISNVNKQKIEGANQKAKAPNSRLNTSPSPTAKKPPHRSFASNSKKPGRTDWDDSAKLEALRNKNPQKQRQKVHIIGENDDSLTSETSGYSGEKVSILSASLARTKKRKV